MAATTTTVQAIAGGSGFDNTAPGPIGGTTPSTIAGTTISASTQFLAPDGLVSAPGFAFTSVPNTGWYPSGGALQSTVAGTNSVRIYASAIAPAGVASQDLGGPSPLLWKRLYIDFTNTGTVGAVTINKAAGRVNIAAAGTSVVVTNSLCTAASKVFCTVASNDSTALLKNVVPAAGSFTITMNAAVTAQTSIDFFIVNTD